MVASGPVTSLAFHTSAEAARQLEIIPQICLLAIGLLFVFSIYLILRIIFTPAGNLSKAPAHVRNASPILIWIASMSLLLAFMAAGFDLYDQFWHLGVSGKFDPYPFVTIFMTSLLILGLGFFAALIALLGTALIFFKKQKSAKEI